MIVSSPVYNEDKLLARKGEILSYQEQHETWVPLWDYFEFCVLSGLAPQAVDDPWMNIWCRLLDRRRNKKHLLVHRFSTKTSGFKALSCFVACECPENLGGAQARIAYYGEAKDFSKRNTKATRGSLLSNRYIRKKYGILKPSRNLLKTRVELQAKLAEGEFQYDEYTPSEWRQDAFRTVNCIKGELKSGIVFEEPTCSAWGMTDQSSTGAHFNLIIIDDPVGEKSKKSVPLKEKTRSAFYELQSQLVTSDTGLIIVVGTRHAHDDLHATIMEEYAREYDIECFSCWGDGPKLTREDFVQSPSTGKYKCMRGLDQVQVFWDGYGQLEADRARGYALPPDERKEKALQELADKMFSMPPSRFANQFENVVTSDEQQIFYDWMFKTYRRVPPAVNTYILTDSATGQDRGASYRVAAAVCIDENDVSYVRDVQYGYWGPEDYMSRALNMYSRWGASKMLMEKVSWQETFKTVLRLICQRDGLRMPNVIDVSGRTAITKVERIEALEPYFRESKILFDPDLKMRETPDGRKVWSEIVRQFVQVTDAATVQSLKADIPDALSDILVLDKDGKRICRPARKSRYKDQSPDRMRREAVMEPLTSRIAETRKRNQKPRNTIWGKPEGPKTLWKRGG